MSVSFCVVTVARGPTRCEHCGLRDPAAFRRGTAAALPCFRATVSAPPDKATCCVCGCLRCVYTPPNHCDPKSERRGFQRTALT